MPVEKYRDVSEAVPPRVDPRDPRNLRIAFELSELTLKLGASKTKRGVRRYPSLEAAQSDRNS